jgi:hypothetical protein
MFHHHRHETSDSVIAAPPVRSVKLLESDEDLRAAVERASAFERARAADRSGRALGYERYLRQPADVVHIDDAGAAAST